MAVYEGPQIEGDPDLLAEQAFDYLRGVIPGWEPAEGEGLTTAVLATARVIADGQDVAADVADAIYRTFGRRLAGVPPRAATRAVGSATVTAVDDAGYTLPAGTPVLVRTAGDAGVTFSVVEDVVIEPGQTSSARGEVSLLCEVDGEQGNGLDETAQAVVVRQLRWVQSIELVGQTAGGADPEPDDAYLDRLTGELQLMTPAPILPADFARLVVLRVPGIARALALNLYDPDSGTWGHPRTVTVAVHADGGGPVSRAIRDQARQLLEQVREVNWRCPVIDPAYTSIDVVYEASCWAGWDPAEVQAQADAAVSAFLSPAGWGRPPDAEPETWTDEPLVRWLEVADALQRVPGLRHVLDLRIGRSGDSLAAADVTLAGPAGLPRPGSISGTVRED